MTKRIEFEVASPKFKVLYKPKRYKVFYGGRGGAKSWGLAQAAVYYMVTTKVRILSCRMHLNSIRESNHKLIADTIARMGLSNLFVVGQYEITCVTTGSTMFFKGLSNNFASLKSIEDVGICLVDEAEGVTEEAWRFLIPTIRAKGSEIWISFNPRMVTDATWQRFVVNPPANSVVVKIDYHDNPYLSKDLIEEMLHDKATDPVRYQWVWEGEPMGAEEHTLIPPSIILAAKSRIPVRDESLKIYAGLDVSTMGKDWTVLIRRRGSEILSVHKMHKGDTIAVSNWAKNIYTEHGWDSIVVDATGSSGVADQLNEWANANRVFEVTAWNASRSPRNKRRFTNARTESWVIMRDWLSTQGMLTKDQEWEELSKVLYKYNIKEQIQLESKKNLSKSPDFGDALALSLWYPDEKKVVRDNHITTYNPPVDNGGMYKGPNGVPFRTY